MHDRTCVVPLHDPRLADPGEDENLVVHRQPEQHGEQTHRQERDDGDGLLETDRILRPTPLEHGDDHPVGGGDAEQVHQRCFRSDERRAEHGGQQ